MSVLTNSPQRELTLRLESRKSFALGVFITDATGRGLDISTSELNLVVKKTPLDSSDITDADNLVLNGAAVVLPETNYAQINLQATDLAFPVGEYGFALVLRHQGYSAVIARGTLELLENPEFASVGYEYTDGGADTALTIALRGMQTVSIAVGSVPPPGAAIFTDADRDKLDGIEAGAQKQVVTTVDGSTISLANVPDSATRLAMTSAERVKLAGLTGAAPAWGDITGKPTFGSAAYAAVTDFLPATGVDADKITSGVLTNARVPTVAGLRGFSSGTAAPTGGADGDLYFQYT